MPWQSPCPPPSSIASSRRGILRHGRWGPGTSICQKNDLKALSCQPKWDNLHISHWRMQIYFCYEMNYFLPRLFTCWAWGGGPDHRLQIQKTYPLCRGGRNCQTQRIFLLSSSAADDWPSVNQTSDQSENQKLNFSRVSHYYFFHPIHSISYLNRFLIFYINVSDLVFHSAPF